MKETELMIGDWVLTPEGKPTQVYQIYNGFVSITEPAPILYNVECLQPVNLTSEILEKNGFVYRKNSGAFIVYAEESYSNQTVEVTLFNVESEFRNIQLHICESNSPQETILHLMDCNYVHELQHVFKVCKIKKDIKL